MKKSLVLLGLGLLILVRDVSAYEVRYDVKERLYGYKDDVVMVATEETLVITNEKGNEIKDLKEVKVIDISQVIREEVNKGISMMKGKGKEEVKEEVKSEVKEVKGERKKVKVFFNFNSYRLECEQREYLRREVEALKNAGFKNIEVEVYGKADVIGGEKYNKKLSFLRAKAVAEYLEKLGVKVKKVEGKGETKEHCIFGLNRIAEVELKAE
ncbi:MAG: OmpA family protein [bacterium]|jgi:outer membrane protein OmpA-like peptidoglycan-associated protein